MCVCFDLHLRDDESVERAKYPIGPCNAVKEDLQNLEKNSDSKNIAVID